MPYGVKRGVKSPGEFNTVDLFGLALAGSAGILAALITDYQQKGESAAILTINEWVATLARMFSLGDVPLWAVAAGVVVAGAASVLYFQPITRQGAFAQGFGLLAVLMTTVPSNLGGSLQSSDPDLAILEPIVMSESLEAKLVNVGSVVPATAQASEARVYKVQDTRNAAKYDLSLYINFPKGVPANVDTMIRQGQIRGRLHNADTKTTYNLFRSAGAAMERTANALVFRVGVPARAESATLWVRIEVEGYTIEEQSAAAKLSGPLVWQIDLQPSSTPLFIQRLGKSYWF